MIDPGLAQKTAIVTGGNNPEGIGAAIAQALAEQGARVFIHFYRPPAAPPTGDGGTPVSEPGEARYRQAQTRSAGEVAAAIRERGGSADCWEADLAASGAASSLFDRAEQAFGPVSILVNNAALCEPDTLLPGRSPDQGERSAGGLGPLTSTITAESHDRHFAVNSRAPALLMAEFARRHAARGASWGRIVNISSDGASGGPGEASYWASKHALESFSRCAAADFGPLGITVNVLSLGPIQTGWMPPELESAVAKSTPLGRAGRPADVAAAAVFLASDQARWLTGQLIYVGGGHRMPL